MIVTQRAVDDVANLIATEKDLGVQKGQPCVFAHLAIGGLMRRHERVGLAVKARLGNQLKRLLLKVVAKHGIAGQIHRRLINQQGMHLAFVKCQRQALRKRTVGVNKVCGIGHGELPSPSAQRPHGSPRNCQSAKSTVHRTKIDNV